MNQITIQGLYEKCDVLISVEDLNSFYIQMYDNPVLEDQNGLIQYEFKSDLELVEITEDGNILIDNCEYEVYNYQKVSKEYLTSI